MSADQTVEIPNQPGLNIDLTRMREAALHAQVHGAVFKANGSQVRQVLDYLHERTLEIKRLHARVQELEAQQAVPQGWVLVPKEPPEEMARAFRADDAPAYFSMTTIHCADFVERYAAMLAAAPTPPAQHKPKYRLLERGVDAIELADEFLKEDGVTWVVDPKGIFVGMKYQGDALLPARRPLGIGAANSD